MTDQIMCTCGLGANSFTTSYCAAHAQPDAPEVEVIAKALAEWSSPQYPWEDRHPKNREHWLKLARVGYAAMNDAHARWRVHAA